MVINLLRLRGLDVESAALRGTPARVRKAFLEMTVGYEQDPAEILSTTFGGAFDSLVVVSGIQFVSLCEHHLLPFVGEARVGYLPSGRVVGLSKIPRLVECFAKRLQLQERLTMQIASALVEHLGAKAVGVVIVAEHSCMSCRGVEKRAKMRTSSMLGLMRDQPELRAEFFSV